jgi:transposase
MAIIKLSLAARRSLEQIVCKTNNAKQLKRAQGLLALDDDEPVAKVGQRAGVSRQTVYDWVRRFQEREGEPIAQRLLDRPRSGRPPTKREAATALIQCVMGTDPRTYGYRALDWTIPLLQEQLRRETGLEVGEQTIGRCLHQLGYRWKRPRHVLSRRSPTWRQAKGGLNGA